MVCSREMNATKLVCVAAMWVTHLEHSESAMRRAQCIDCLQAAGLVIPSAKLIASSPSLDRRGRRVDRKKGTRSIRY